MVILPYRNKCKRYYDDIYCSVLNGTYFDSGYADAGFMITKGNSGPLMMTGLRLTRPHTWPHHVHFMEGNVYLTTHSTHFIYGYMASDMW